MVGKKRGDEGVRNEMGMVTCTKIAVGRDGAGDEIVETSGGWETRDLRIAVTVTQEGKSKGEGEGRDR